MRKMLVCLMSVFAIGSVVAQAVVGGNDCVWTGGGADNKWSTAANWQDGIRPSGENLDRVTIDIGSTPTAAVNDIEGLKLGKVVITGKNDITFTLSGQAITFGGASSLNEAVLTNGCSVVLENDFRFERSGSVFFSGVSTVVRGNLAVVGDCALKIRGRTTNAVDSKEGYNLYGYPDLIGNKVDIAFYGTVGGELATLYIETGANGNGTSPYFHGNVVCDKLFMHANTRPCSPHFCKSGNQIGEIVFMASTCYIDAANGFTEDTVLNPGLGVENHYTWSAKAIFATGTEQVLNRLAGDPQSAYVSKKRTFGNALMVGNTTGNTANPCTLRLRGTDDAVCNLCLYDGIGVTWDPKGDYTQDFADRIHPACGDFVVKGGTLRTSGTNVFLNVPTVHVHPGATLEIASTNSDHAAFKSLSLLVLEGNATLKIADAHVRAFSDNAVGAVLDAGAKIVVPEGAVVKLGRLAVGGVELAAADYSGESWIAGAGTVSVSGQITSNRKVWWMPVDGSWTDATKWLDGSVPKASDNAYLNADGTYEVTYGSTAVRPAQLVLGGTSGMAKLKVDGNVAWGGGKLSVRPCGRLEVPEASKLSISGSPTIGVAGGEVAVNGGTLVVTNFAGTFTVSGTEANTGRLAVVHGTLAWHASDNAVAKQLTLQNCGELVLKDDGVYENSTGGKNPSCVNLVGGRQLIESSRYGTVGQVVWDLSSRETIFSGTSKLVNDNESNRFVLAAPAGDQDVLVALRGQTEFADKRFDSISIGGASSGTGECILEFDSERPFATSAANGRICYGMYIAKPSGRGTLRLKRGYFLAGPRGILIGRADGGRYGNTSTLSGGRGRFEVSGGGVTIPSDAVNEGQMVGLVIGDGTSLNETLLTNYTTWEGTFLQTGGVVTNKGNTCVGGPRSIGRFVKTGGDYRSDNAGYPFMVGVAGGTGTCLLGGGSAFFKSDMYVGGVLTNAIQQGSNPAYGLGPWGWPIDDHSAVGSLTVTGGTMTLQRDLNVGFDGKGTIAVEGSAADISITGNLVLSNTVARVTASALSFKLDGSGVSPIKVAGKVVNTVGTKLAVDLEAYKGKKCSFPLITFGQWEGASVEDVELTGELARRASLRNDGSTLAVVIERGTLLIFR